MICRIAKPLGWTLLGALAIATATVADVPEPMVTLYGKVSNQVGLLQEPVVSGAVSWVLRDEQTPDTELRFTATLGNFASGAYNYRVDIPQKLLAAGSVPALVAASSLSEDGAVAIVGKDTRGYVYSVEINGQEAELAAGVDGLDLGQIYRASVYRIDLKVKSGALVDSDGDGMPDSWELAYFDDLAAADPDADSDGDGWSNAREAELGTNPLASNKAPMLANNQMVLFEQGTQALRLGFLDSDSSVEQIQVAIEALPDGLKLLVADEDGSHFTEAGLPFTATADWFNRGAVLLQHVPTAPDTNVAAGNSPETVSPPAALALSLTDQNRLTSAASVGFSLFRPSKASGGGRLWLDGTVRLESSDLKVVDRIGNWSLPFMGDQGSTNEAVTFSSTGPGAKPVLDFNGEQLLMLQDSAGDAGTIAALDGTALFMLMRTSGSGEQVLMHDTSRELVIGASDHDYPRRLHFRQEGQRDLVSSAPIPDGFGVVALLPDGDLTQVEWNGRPVGSVIRDERLSEAAAASLSATTEWSRYFSLAGKYGTGSPSGLEGQLGEVLMMSCGSQCQDVKWSTYAWLYSKWFGQTVLDARDATTPVKLFSREGQLFIEKHLNPEFQTALLGADYVDIDAYPLLATAAVIDSPYGPHWLLGGPENDLLVASGSDDILVGGTGQDRYLGLGGADTFVVGNGDVVLDFSRSDGDSLVIEQLLSVEDLARPLSAYVSFLRSAAGTSMLIDSNGDGSGADYQIMLTGQTLQNSDLASLWASGAIRAGGVRPAVTLQLEAVTASSVVREGNGFTFRITASGAPLPLEAELPLAINGSVERSDYQLNVLYPDQEPLLLDSLSVPLAALRSAAGAAPSSVTLQLLASSDTLAESNESLTLELLPQSDYQLGTNSQLALTLTDAPAVVSFVDTADTSVVCAFCIYESPNTDGVITLRREGTLDTALSVNLVVNGTATSGVDYSSLVSDKVVFAAGEDTLTIRLTPYNDGIAETVEYIELSLLAGDGYSLGDLAQTRLALLDRRDQDLDGDGLPDIWELNYGLDVYQPDVGLDSDGDGISNIDEYLNQTNPLVADTRSDDDTVTIQASLQRQGSDALLTLAGDSLSLPWIVQSGDSSSPHDFELRLYFNSEQLEVADFASRESGSLLSNDLLVMADSSNGDDDDSTDVYIAFNWKNTSDNWLDSAEPLLTTRIRVLGMTDSSRVNLRTYALTAGYAFSGATLTLASLSSSIGGPLASAVQVDGADVAFQVRREGLLLMRYLTGLSDAEIASGLAVTAFTTRTDIENGWIPYLDIDGDGEVGAFTDGLLFSRCISGVSTDFMLNNLPTATMIRDSADAISRYCEVLLP